MRPACCRFAGKIFTLPLHFQIPLGQGFPGFLPVATLLLLAREVTVQALEFLLCLAIVTRVLHRVPFGVGVVGFQAHINADVRMLTRGWFVVGVRFRLTDNQGVPMPIGSVNEVNCLGSALDGAMQFDLEDVTQLLGNDEMLLVLMQIHIFAVLTQLDGVPTVRLLEAWEADIRQAQLFGGEETFEGLGETISQHLDRGRWHMLTATSFELGGQIILRGKCPLLCMLLLQGREHLIVQDARLFQALHEQARLFFRHEQAILKRSHTDILLHMIRLVKQGLFVRGRPFIPIAEARSPLAALSRK